MFLSSPSEERLYVGKRKGFIKLAMRTGSEIIPCYYFGNTTCLEVAYVYVCVWYLLHRVGALVDDSRPVGSNLLCKG